MVLAVLLACADVREEPDEDTGLACIPEAVAAFEYVPSQVINGAGAALLDPSGSTLCPGDQVVWWVDDVLGWRPVTNMSLDVPEGYTQRDVGTSLHTDVILHIVPEGEMPESHEPCIEWWDDIFDQACGYLGIDWLYVEIPYQYEE